MGFRGEASVAFFYCASLFFFFHFLQSRFVPAARVFFLRCVWFPPHLPGFGNVATVLSHHHVTFMAWLNFLFPFVDWPSFIACVDPLTFLTCESPSFFGCLRIRYSFLWYMTFIWSKFSAVFVFFFFLSFFFLSFSFPSLVLYKVWHYSYDTTYHDQYYTLNAFFVVLWRKRWGRWRGREGFVFSQYTIYLISPRNEPKWDWLLLSFPRLERRQDEEDEGEHDWIWGWKWCIEWLPIIR